MGTLYFITDKYVKFIKIGYTEKPIEEYLEELKLNEVYPSNIVHHSNLRILATKQGTKEEVEEIQKSFEKYLIREGWYYIPFFTNVFIYSDEYREFEEYLS